MVGVPKMVLEYPPSLLKLRVEEAWGSNTHALRDTRLNIIFLFQKLGKLLKGNQFNVGGIGKSNNGEFEKHTINNIPQGGQGNTQHISSTVLHSSFEGEGNRVLGESNTLLSFFECRLS